MRSSLFLVSCLAALLSTATIFTATALSNEGLPLGPQVVKSEPANLVVERDVGAKTSRIIIPAKFLPADAGEGKVGAISPTRSIVAGVALSCAIACVFIVARRGNRKAIAAVVVLGLIAAGAVTSAVADIRLPDEPEKKAQIVIEVVAEGDEVVLIQGRDFGR